MWQKICRRYFSAPVSPLMLYPSTSPYLWWDNIFSHLHPHRFLQRIRDLRKSSLKFFYIFFNQNHDISILLLLFFKVSIGCKCEWLKSHIVYARVEYWIYNRDYSFNYHLKILGWDVVYPSVVVLKYQSHWCSWLSQTPHQWYQSRGPAWWGSGSWIRCWILL